MRAAPHACRGAALPHACSATDAARRAMGRQAKTVTKTSVRTKDRNGKKLTNWQIFMQVELPKLRAADSALGHKEAFAVGQPCPPTTPERRVPDNGRLGSSDLHSVRFQALAKSWQAKSDVEKAAYVAP